MDQDPTETNNLAEKYSEKVSELDALFQAWKKRLPDFSNN